MYCILYSVCLSFVVVCCGCVLIVVVLCLFVPLCVIRCLLLCVVVRGSWFVVCRLLFDVCCLVFEVCSCLSVSYVVCCLLFVVEYRSLIVFSFCRVLLCVVCC